MSTYLVDSTDMTAIANAIRQKDGTQTTMTVSDMPTRIQNIPTGGGTDYMAERCQGTLSSYTIPNTCTKISTYAFFGMPINSIAIPSSVTDIGAYAFNSCASLTSLTLPSTVTSMGTRVFSSCTSLASVIWESSMDLPGYTFESCSSLTSLTFPQTMGSFGQYAFSSCASLTSLTFPQTMGSINASCFSGCRNLETVTFPTSLKAGTTSFFADYYTFSNCYKLKTLVNFDPSVLGTRLPMGTFSSTALEGNITLGPEFTALMYSFNNNNSTGILYIHLTQTDASLLTSKYSLNSLAFDKTHCRLVVPVGMLSDYQTAFPTYSSIMIEETN